MPGMTSESGSLPRWRRMRAVMLRAFGLGRLRVVDGELAAPRAFLELRPLLTITSDGLVLAVRPMSTTGSPLELRSWKGDWQLIVHPLWRGAARLAISGRDGGYTGRIAGRWPLGYADAITELVDRLRVDPAAQVGLSDPRAVAEVVAILDGHALGWPVAASKRSAVVGKAITALRARRPTPI